MSARLLAASIAILSVVVGPTTTHAGQPAQIVIETTDATHQWQSTTCDVVVEGNCLEP